MIRGFFICCVLGEMVEEKKVIIMQTQKPKSKGTSYLMVGMLIIFGLVGSLADSEANVNILPFVFIVMSALVVGFSVRKAKAGAKPPSNSPSASWPVERSPLNPPPLRPKTMSTTPLPRPIRKSEQGLSAQVMSDNERDYKMCQSCGYRVKRSVFRCPVCNTIIRHRDPHSDLR